MPFSDYLKNDLLDNMTLPTADTVFIAMFAGGAPGVGTEVVPATLWGSGNRPACVLDAASSGARTPNGDEVLGTVDVSSQAVTHMAAYDAATGGNLLAYIPWAKTLEATDEVKIGDTVELFKITDPA
jgi:hypothetical protein